MVCGPRGCGKTTLVKSLLRDIKYYERRSRSKSARKIAKLKAKLRAAKKKRAMHDDALVNFDTYI